MSRHKDWFENIVEHFKNYLSEQVADGIIEAWQYGEEEIAYTSLIGSLEWQDVTFPLEIQQQLLEYAAQLDKYNQDKWNKYQKELTPEEIKKYDLKKGITDYEEELHMLFKRSNKSPLRIK